MAAAVLDFTHENLIDNTVGERRVTIRCIYQFQQAWAVTGLSTAFLENRGCSLKRQPIVIKPPRKWPCHYDCIGLAVFISRQILSASTSEAPNGWNLTGDLRMGGGTFISQHSPPAILLLGSGLPLLICWGFLTNGGFPLCLRLPKLPSKQKEVLGSIETQGGIIGSFQFN